MNGSATRLRIGGVGPDLIYLHGLFGEPRWMAHHDTLSKTFRVIFPDLPGYGRSEEGEVESIDDLSFWLRDLLETMRVERPLIVGHSIGGWVGAQFALLWPNLVSKLVLVSPAGLRAPGFTPPDVMLIQVEFDTAVHAQPLVVVTENVLLPPVAPIVAPLALSV